MFSSRKLLSFIHDARNDVTFRSWMNFPQLWRNNRIISVCLRVVSHPNSYCSESFFFGIYSLMVLIWRLKDFAGNSKNNDESCWFFRWTLPPPLAICRHWDAHIFEGKVVLEAGENEKPWKSWEKQKSLRYRQVSRMFVKWFPRHSIWYAWLLSGSWFMVVGNYSYQLGGQVLRFNTRVTWWAKAN